MASSEPPPPPPLGQCSGGAASTSGQANVQSAVQFWEQMVNHWYPKLEQEPCFLPHVHFNKLNYKTVQVGGQDFPLTERPVDHRQPGDKSLSNSDAKDDKTSQRLLFCLRQFATQHKIPMFVLQELNFSDYLDDPKYSAVTQKIPRPCDLKPPTTKKKKSVGPSAAPHSAAPQDPLHRGDLDLLIIHPDYGLLVGELKTVGDTFTGSAADQQKEDDTVVKRVEKAIKQLNKERTVLMHVVSDFKPAPRVRATLILPNISRSQLQRVLNNNSAVQQDLSQCLDVTSGAETLDLCLCADNMSDKDTPYNVTDDVINAMLSWWSHTMTSRGHDTASATHFRSIVARFAGPATTVRIACVSEPRLCLHTVGEAIAETGRRFADIVLHPHQLAALTDNEPRLFLLGGPGCGKSILLVLRAVTWLQDGHHVCVVSIRGKHSLASCEMLCYLIQQMTDPAAHHRLSLHKSDEADEALLQATVKDLLTKVDDQKRLFLIVDEAYYCSSIFDPTKRSPNAPRSLYDALQHQVPNLHMWIAACDGRDIPQGMKIHKLTVPLRSPPLLVQRISESDQFTRRECPAYSQSDAPLPSDGPPVHEMFHVDGEREHCTLGEGGDLGKCEQCGMDTASYLLEDLHVGHTGSTTAFSPNPLTFKDVLVIPCSFHLQDEERDDAGKVLRDADPFVQGLRRGGLPVRVVKGDDATAMYEMAVNSGPDQIIVASNGRTVRGLERKVVVLIDVNVTAVPHLEENFDLVSRCTSQLVWVLKRREKSEK